MFETVVIWVLGAVGAYFALNIIIGVIALAFSIYFGLYVIRKLAK